MINMSNFIAASVIIEQTEYAEKNRKANARICAEKILEEFDFNAKVKEAAAKEQWHLKEWIECPSHDVANAMCEIMKELGYDYRSQRRAGSKSEAWGVAVSWSRKNTRSINLEDIAP